MKGRTNVGAWCTAITPHLKEILAAMLSFDYGNLLANIPEEKLPTKNRPLLLWHELNVFFLRGMYFEEPFRWTVGWDYPGEAGPPMKHGKISDHDGSQDEAVAP